MHGLYWRIRDWELASSSKESNDLELVSTQAEKTNVVAAPFQDYYVFGLVDMDEVSTSWVSNAEYISRRLQEEI